MGLCFLCFLMAKSVPSYPEAKTDDSTVAIKLTFKLGTIEQFPLD